MSSHKDELESCSRGRCQWLSIVVCCQCIIHSECHDHRHLRKDSAFHWNTPLGSPEFTTPCKLIWNSTRACSSMGVFCLLSCLICVRILTIYELIFLQGISVYSQHLPWYHATHYDYPLQWNHF